jgi:hypothetical protein
MLCKLRYSLTTLAALLSTGLVAVAPAAAASKSRPSQAHVAISTGDGHTIESKKGRNTKVLGTPPSNQKANKRR